MKCYFLINFIDNITIIVHIIVIFMSSDGTNIFHIGTFFFFNYYIGKTYVKFYIRV
jgi:hypothetical protein